MEVQTFFMFLFLFPALNAKAIIDAVDNIKDEEENVEKVEEITAMDRIMEVNGLNFKHVDMIYPEKQEKAESQEGVEGDLIRNTLSRWPKTGSTVNVPYVISQANPAAIKALRQAFREFYDKTCIRFVRRTNQRDYVRVIAGGGCYSYVGRVGGRQDISLGRGCEYKSTAVHEFMHALGFWHEQSRPDRDQYIKVNYNNILPQFRRQFNKQSSNSMIVDGTPYDYESVMHYSAYAFSKAYRRLPSIERKSSTDRLKFGNNYGLSELDAKSLNMAYCISKPTVTTTTSATPQTEINTKTVQGWLKILSELSTKIRNALRGIGR